MTARCAIAAKKETTSMQIIIPKDLDGVTPGTQLPFTSSFDPSLRQDRRCPAENA
jgi:hypothetical protein